MKPTDTDRYCIACGADFLGERIPEENRAHYVVDEHFSRRMGVYCLDRDRTVAWKCPDCGHRVDR